MNIEPYSSHCFILKGVTIDQEDFIIKVKEKLGCLSSIGGTWNSKLSCWTFPNIYRSEVENIINEITNDLKKETISEEELLVKEFAYFINNKYSEKGEKFINYKQILLYFIESYTQLKITDDTDIYFNNEYTYKLREYFCDFFSYTNTNVPYAIYSKIDTIKFIEYALIILIKKYNNKK